MPNPPRPRARVKLPASLLDAIRKLGGRVTKCPGEDLHSVEGVLYGSPVWDIYEQWAASSGGDPQLTCGFWPSADIVRTALAPPEHMAGAITREVQSLIYYYAQLRAEDIDAAGEAPIGAPLPAPPAIVHVHHAKLALSALMSRIQHPPENYPILAALRAGSYICNISQVWSNTVVDIVLYKP